MKKNFESTTKEETFDIVMRSITDKFLETKSHYQIANVDYNGEFKGEILFILWAKTDKNDREFSIQFCPTPEIPNDYIEGLVEAFDKSGAISDIVLNGNKFCNISKRPLSDWIDAINNDLNISDMPYIKFAA